jgi:hypothetical protein
MHAKLNPLPTQVKFHSGRISAIISGINCGTVMTYQNVSIRQQHCTKIAETKYGK